MKKEIEICDWCEDDEAVVRIIKGEGIDEVLCDDCKEEYIESLSEDYLEDIEGEEVQED